MYEKVEIVRPLELHFRVQRESEGECSGASLLQFVRVTKYFVLQCRTEDISKMTTLRCFTLKYLI